MMTSGRKGQKRWSRLIRAGALGMALFILFANCRRHTEDEELSTRITASGSVSNLTLQFSYCTNPARTPPVSFVVIRRVDGGSAAEPVCRLDRLDVKGPELGSLWFYGTTPSNYRRTGCTDLQPGRYVVSAGAVGDAVSRFEIRENGSVLQGPDVCKVRP